MSDLISREETFTTLCEEYPLLQREYLRGVIDKVPSAEPNRDMIHLQKEQAYMQGWADGQEALRKEIWEDGRDRLD